MTSVTVDTSTPAAIVPLLVDVKRLSKMLSCSIRTAWRLNASGKIPSPVKFGRSVRWDYQTIRIWTSRGCPDRATFEAKLRAERGGLQRER